MFGMGTDIGIDLGTAYVLVYVKGKGIVLREPSIVAIKERTGEVIAVGEEARKMVGRTPANIVTIKPLKQGVISDYDATEQMLKYFIHKAIGYRLIKPCIGVCVPSGITEVERRDVEDATRLAGARYVETIEEPIAAAIGAGIDISRPCGSMIVDIGGGTTDIAVISLGGAVVKKSIKVAGDNFDETIIKYMRKKYSMLIGERTAEEIKINVGSVLKREIPAEIEIPGRFLASFWAEKCLWFSNMAHIELRYGPYCIAKRAVSRCDMAYIATQNDTSCKAEKAVLRLKEVVLVADFIAQQGL